MTRVCLYCNVTARFTFQWSDDHWVDDFDSFTRFVATCDNCGMPVCGAYTSDDDPEDIKVWPAFVANKSYPDVPAAMASAASEAHQALGAEAPRAALAVARAVIEAIAKDKGITQGILQAKINQLAAGGHISEAMKEAAHAIRLVGNDAAHGDLVGDLISIDEAREVVDLMDDILEDVYQRPAKVARVRAGREARRNRQEPASAAS